MNRWILIVIGLLAGNALAGVILITAAGGTSHRVIPHYYERAVAYDQTMAEAATSRRLGWNAQVDIDGRTLQLTLRDRSGAPLDGLAITVNALPRGHADEPVTGVAEPSGQGHYKVTLHGIRHGLHDLTIAATRGPDRWSEDREIDVGAPR